MSLKTVSLQFGSSHIEVDVPGNSDILSAGTVATLPDPAAAVRECLREPVGSAPLPELARGCDNAVVVVSDKTRPVPYSGPKGILPPIVEKLKANSVNKIKILVGCGTHRPMAEPELRDMLGDSAFQDGVEVINHVCTDEAMLRSIGKTERTGEVKVNSHYLDAQLKIATGLVEPHFMAGFSGGRKAICPGVCGQSVTYGLHSASILNEEGSTNLVLDGNPCHEEALRIAKMAGVDFTVNVTIDNNKEITGVFAGELEKAHLAAVEHLRSYAAIPVAKSYDVVITQAGDVGVNHYQCVKAVFEASRVAKPDGKVILLGDLTDPDPVGNPNYKEMLRLAIRLGPEDYLQKILAPDWAFVPDQWEVQMWAKAYRRLAGPKEIYICAPQLEDCPADSLPETNVAAQNKRLPGESNADFARRILQQTIDRLTRGTGEKETLVLPEGPYAVPQ
ncbi:MAG: nickel-dependent lactate racemase [Phycisphaerales bacterium]|nr:MAG: nickel-dependent lactate racemase [Phycisphaerales bacterium]